MADLCLDLLRRSVCNETEVVCRAPTQGVGIGARRVDGRPLEAPISPDSLDRVLPIGIIEIDAAAGPVPTLVKDTMKTGIPGERRLEFKVKG